MRSQRENNQLRNIIVTKDFMKNAFSSCLIEFGNTKVICSVSIEYRVPRWLKGSGKGWLTAEYSMLPTSTNTRNERDINKGKLSGRSQEIQRLIGRSLRNSIDLTLLENILIKVDCDVLSADGGTRTTAINGSWIALSLAVNRLKKENVIKTNPLNFCVTAISCGIFGEKILLDLDYNEDSNADADANFIFNNKGDIIEIQCTGEKSTISEDKFLEMYRLAKNSIKDIYKVQYEATK